MAAVILLVIDTEGKVTRINNKGCQVLGYEKKETIGKDWFDNFIPPRLKNEVASVYKKLISGEINSASFNENLVLTKSGEERLIAWYNTVIRDDQGKIISTYSAGVDTAEGKQAQNHRRMLLRPAASGRLTPFQEKYINNGLKEFNDREIIELFLSLCPDDFHQRQLKQIIQKFKNIRGLLSASTEELVQAGLDDHCIFLIKLMEEIPIKVMEEKIKEKPVYESPLEIIDYLNYSMRDLKEETFKMIGLNSRNQITDVIDLFKGTSNRIAINATEVIEGAFKHNTTVLIFVHNHPSGDPTPSLADKHLTRDLVFVGKILQIRVLDHIVIGDNRYYSFAGEGLIKEYELDFLNLKLTGTSEAEKRLTEARLFSIK